MIFEPVTGRLESINGWEAEFLREEVAGYFTGLVELEPGAVVVDAGANVGMFSAAVHDRLGGDARIYAFEPVPAIHSVLARNARLFGGALTALPYGLGDTEKEMSFTYFPAATILSSSRRDAGTLSADVDRLKSAITVGVGRHGGPLLRRVPARLLRPLLAVPLRRLRRMDTCSVRIRRLSDVIDEHGIDRIHLLKVDVEGAELELLAGVEDRHWPLIDQVVLEVERWTADRDRAERILAGRGFTVRAEQSPVQAAGDYGMLWAVRERAATAVRAAGSSGAGR